MDRHVVTRRPVQLTLRPIDGAALHKSSQYYTVHVIRPTPFWHKAKVVGSIQTIPMKLRKLVYPRVQSLELAHFDSPSLQWLDQSLNLLVF